MGVLGTGHDMFLRQFEAMGIDLQEKLAILGEKSGYKSVN